MSQENKPEPEKKQAQIQMKTEERSITAGSSDTFSATSSSSSCHFFPSECKHKISTRPKLLSTVAKRTSEYRKSVLFRLLSNMIVTATAKPNLSLHVTLGHHRVEGISYNQFIHLFDSMEAACNRSFIHFKKYEAIVEFGFSGNVVGIYKMDGSKPIFLRRTIRSRLLFQNEYHASLQFTLSEIIPLSEVEVGKPENVQIMERWVFVHKNKVRYELMKTAVGKTKEDACSQNPTFLVRMFVTPISRPHMYTELLLRKSYDIFGFGPNPELHHCSLRHKGKKKE